jgi:hypothetical protein
MNEKYSKESREGYKVVKYVTTIVSTLSTFIAKRHARLGNIQEVTKVIETTML